MNPLNHVAIIMDGNGRWGIKHKKSRNAGHKAGLKTVEKIINVTINNRINYLTLYAFSTENWKRPKKEIAEDEEKKFEKNIQTFTDEHVKNIDVKVLSKEKEIMTI